MSRLEGQVAVISGAARGQGRAHAIAMAREGASIVAFDLCEPLESPLHPGATEDDLAETKRLVEEAGQRCLTAKVDARDLPALQKLAAQVEEEFGRLDTLVVNHGLWAIHENSWTVDEAHWQESIDVMVTGAWKVTAAFIPTMLNAGNGGSIILTSSVMGLKPQPSSVAYTVAKHGVLGLMRTLAWELGDKGIRANAVLPGGVDTPMVQGGTVEKSLSHWPRYFSTDRTLAVPVGSESDPNYKRGWVPAEHISNAVVFLASRESEFITGVPLPIDGGWLNF